MSGASKPRLFLSYGRADAAALAERLERDLIARGYEVWKDRVKILPGDDWREKIKDGILSTQVVIALLSPHAVRVSTDPGSPDHRDSICLDELSFAQFARKRIVPVMAQPCEPPFCIFRLDYVDLAAWEKFPQQYEQGLARIQMSIDSALAGDPPTFRVWNEQLKPWDFSGFLHEKREGFVGREWLFDRIDAWRVTSSQPALLIKGDPGIGKSAIVAELAHRFGGGGQVIACYCCQADTHATLDPAQFVRSVAGMIASQVPAYAAQLPLPEIADALSEARCAQDPASSFERGILTPLQACHAPIDPAQGARYILIDALDEALLHDSGKRTIVDLLSTHVRRLPPWLRIVATTRKERGVLGKLAGLDPLELDAHEKDNLDDLQRYILGRLQAPDLQQKLASSKLSESAAVAVLRDKADGNFLYAKEALNGIERGDYRFDQLALLPPGLFGLYERFFDRHFGGDETRYAKAATVLSVVVAAFDPLTRADLAAASGLDVEVELPRLLAVLGPYLPARTDAEGAPTYAVYHKSLSDWLAGEVPPQFDGHPYRVSLRKGHERLAAMGWEQYQRGPTSISHYALRHLAEHLAAVERRDDLCGMLCDFHFLEAKVAKVGPQALIDDYDIALKSEATSGAVPDWREPLKLLQGAVRLSSHVVTQDPDQLASQLMGRLLSSAIPTIQELLSRIRFRSKPWLCPLWPSLTPPGGPLLRTLEGHTDDVNSVSLTPDGRRAVSASDDRTLRVWDVETGACLRTLEGHTDDVNSVSVTPDGRRAVSASKDKTLRVWDVETGACLRTLKGHTRCVDSVSLTPDGRRAVSASKDKTLRVWDVETGACLRTLEGHTGHVLSVSLTPDDHRAVSGSEDKTLRVWDVETGQCLRTLEGHTSADTSVALTPDGRRAVSASSDNTLRVWDVETGACLRTLEGHTRTVTSVSLTPDGRRAVSASWDKTLRVWDVETGECLRTLEGHTSAATSVALTPDGRRAVSASFDDTLRVWDVETGQCLRTLKGHADGVRSVSLTPDNRRAVSASWDHTLRVWDVEVGACLRTLKGHTNWVTWVSLTPDGRRAVSASMDQTLRVWDVETGACLRTLEGHTDRVNSVSLTPDGRRAFSGSNDNTLRVWDVETGTCLRTLEGHTEQVTSVSLTPDGRRAVSASDDKTLRVWDVETGTCLRTLEGHTREVTSVSVTPDSRRAVSASDDKTLRVWDVETGTCLRTLEGHTREVTSVSVTPDSRRAVSASDDKTLRVWDVETGQCLRTLEGHTSYVTSVSLTPDGRRAVSASRDKTLRVWDVESGKRIARFTCEGAAVAVAITEHGRKIFAGDASGRVHFLTLENA
ncbi:MAG: TIR domain-containing protein [Phycisphaeraceae bacterium]